MESENTQPAEEAIEKEAPVETEAAGSVAPAESTPEGGESAEASATATEAVA